MNLVEQLRRDEGVRLKPYRDTQGKLTIGAGRNLDDVGITADEASILLLNDIQWAEARLDEALPWAPSLDEARYAVLVNMAFNMGIGGLMGFRRMLAHAKAGEWDAAAEEMLSSGWAQQVGGRAHRLAEQMRSGQWI